MFHLTFLLKFLCSKFPSLLKRLIESLTNKNLKSGFTKTGIYPLDRNQVVKRLLKERDQEEVSQKNSLFHMKISASVT